MLADFAWTELERGIRPDQLAALIGILHREQRLHRYLDELGIAVVGVAVGVGQLHGFHQRMDIFGRIEFHGREIEAAQNVQRFNHGRPLAPEARF